MAYIKKGPTPWEQMGIEATLPGLRLAVNHISDLLRSMEAAAGALSEAGGAATGLKKRGRGEWVDDSPEKRAAVRRGNASGYWAKMTPEERKAEMRRRAKVSLKKGGKMVGLKGKPNRGGAASPNHPSNPKHPQHEAFREKMRQANKRRWAKAAA